MAIYKFWIRLLCVISFLFTSLYFLSGKAIDSYSYLSGSLIIEDSIDRTQIASQILKVFGVFSNNLSGLFYIIIASIFFNRYLHKKLITASRPTLISFLFLFFPYYIAYILLPGKESLVCLSIMSIDLLCKLKKNSNTLIDFNGVDWYLCFQLDIEYTPVVKTSTFSKIVGSTL